MKSTIIKFWYLDRPVSIRVSRSQTSTRPEGSNPTATHSAHVYPMVPINNNNMYYPILVLNSHTRAKNANMSYLLTVVRKLTLSEWIGRLSKMEGINHHTCSQPKSSPKTYMVTIAKNTLKINLTIMHRKYNKNPRTATLFGSDLTNQQVTNSRRIFHGYIVHKFRIPSI